MKKIFFLDGHALVYRAHYAFMTRPLLNSKGWNVSCISGFTRVLLDVIKREKPTHLAVSFDLSGPTFRHEKFEQYKAQREKQPEDITFGLPYIVQILEGMNIPVITKQGFEADDVIGTLAKKAEAEGFEVYMMTPDKDYGQLVSDKIFMYKPARGGDEAEIWGVKEVCENWQIKRVDQVIDMLGMQGDAVDNIPGLPGIGPKSAAALLEKYDTLENVIAHADELKGKQQDIIKNFSEQGLLSKYLARIDINVDVVFDEEHCRITPVNKEVLSELFKELEFRTIAKEILGKDVELPSAKSPTSNVQRQTSAQGDLFANTADAEAAPSVGAFESILPSHSVADKNIYNTPHAYHLIDTPEKYTELINKLTAAGIFAYDSETTNIEAARAEMVGMSFCVTPHEAYYVPVPVDPMETQKIVEIFRPLFENPAVKKIGQNIKYDLIILKNYGVEMQGVYFDTMLAHYLIEPELRHNMNFMSETYLKYAPVEIETLIGKGKNQLSMRDIAVDRVKEYAAEDADVTFQLYQYFKPKLEEAGLEKLFFEIEMPLVEVLTDIEFAGVRIDGNYLNNFSLELTDKIKLLENKVYEEAGTRFNIASPKQVGEVLFDKLKIPYRWKKTGKSDQYSTDEEKMSELAITYPVVQSILDFRGVAKLQSTYVDALPRLINPRTGRVHSSFNQALAATGRLSSQNPNLQNIPVKTEEGRRVRKAFIPRDANHVILSADYSQIELRLIAEMAPEQAMLDAFQNNLDIHSSTAAKVYDTPLDKVTGDQRRNAKTVNFSIIYGAGATNLSQQLSIPRSEAKKLIDAYFEQYKGLKMYMENVVNDARKNGFVVTMMGRKRHIRDINSRNTLASSNAERVAINTPIQGSAADLIKVAMINIHKKFAEQNLQTKMILQVHDELVFDVPKNELETVKPLIADAMKTAFPHLSVPIEVGMGVGDNWLEAH